MILAKVGDIAPGTCVCAEHPYPDTGTITTGAANIFIDGGIPAAVVGTSLVMYSCGTSSILGVSNFFTNGEPLAQAGFSVSGCGNGVLQATSPNFIT